VAIVAAKISGSGRKDGLVCYDYGKTLLETDPHGGNTSCPGNPRRSNDGKAYGAWASGFVGR